MLLRIVSMEWELYNWKVEKVTLPTQDGKITILPWHVNLITTLQSWTLSYLAALDGQSSLDEMTKKSTTLTIWWGVAMIEDNIITVVSE